MTKTIKQDIILSDSESDGESTDEGIRINQKFASAYEKKKRYEELTKYNNHDNNDDDNNSDSSSSESEDEDGVLLTDNLNLKILRTVNALRNKKDNPEIYDSNVKFFNEDDVNVDVLKSKPRKDTKKKHYKDVVREQILKQMEGDDADEDDDEKKRRVENDNVNKSASAQALEYDEEQRKLRADFRKQHNDSDESSDNDDGGDDDFLQLKSSTPAMLSNSVDDAALEKEIELFGKPKKGTNSKDDDNEGDEQDNLVDPRGEVEDGHTFLRDFILKKQWIDKTIKTTLADSASDDVERDFFGDEVDEDMEDVDRMDAFESKFNFRFEEQGLESAPQIVSYARGAAHGAHDDSLRRKDETRKKRRLERQERKARERKAKEEKLRRLKNAKREEMNSKISAIEEASSMGAHFDEETLEKLLLEDFDPDKFNSMMESAYGDDYYGQNDGEWKTDSDVKQGLKEEIDTSVIDYDGEEEEGVEEEHDDDQGNKEEFPEEEGNKEEQDGYEDYDYNGEREEDTHVGKESELSKKLKSKMMDELYKLDYEDIIGDMPCRFKYKDVERNAFGLTPEEILFAKDSSLNQFVGLKKLVPYKEDGEYVPGYKKRYKFRQDAKADYDEVVAQAEENNETAENSSNEEMDEESTKKKRRRQKKGKKGEKKTITEEDMIDKDNNASVDDNAESKKKKRKKLGEKGDKANEEIKESADKSLSLTPAPNTKNKKKKRKRQKKEKASTVEGMSESRFDSYGF